MIHFKRFLKAVLLGIAVFFVISLAGGVLLKLTPMPEEWGYGYLIFAFSATCFITAFYMCAASDKGGLLIGLVTSVFMIIIIFLIVSVLFGAGIEITSILRIWYVIPVLMGTIGGIIGVNIKK